MLSDSQIERYSRQIILPQVGGKGQEKLLHARVLVNGSGLLQTTALLYLAAAGVGTVGVLGGTAPPLFPAFVPDREDALAATLTRLNPDCTVVIHCTEETVRADLLVQQYDLVLSPPDRLHDVCFASRRPFLCAQVGSSQGWLSLCRGYERDRPCLYCLPFQDHEGREQGSFPDVAAAFLGTLQATEALKWLLGVSQTENTKFIECDFPALHFREHMVRKNPHCTFCGHPAAS